MEASEHKNQSLYSIDDSCHFICSLTAVPTETIFPKSITLIVGCSTTTSNGQAVSGDEGNQEQWVYLDPDKGVNSFEGGVHGACAHACGGADHVVWAPQLDRGCWQPHCAADNLGMTLAAISEAQHVVVRHASAQHTMQWQWALQHSIA